MPPKGTGKHRQRLRENFLTRGEQRVNNVLQALKMLSHCANGQSYAYERGEVDEMFKVMSEAFDKCRDQFVQPEQQAERFSFKKETPL